jgi:putative membrane protein
MSFGGWWMALWMLAFWAGVVLLVVWGVRTLSRGGRSDGGADRENALQILKDRFARGEIDRDEFEERRSVLERR